MKLMNSWRLLSVSRIIEYAEKEMAGITKSTYTYEYENKLDYM